MKRLLLAFASLLLLHPAFAEEHTTEIPTPSGVYVLNEASNEQSTATAYASGLTSSSAYQDDITGHAIFVPIAKILPSLAIWGEFH